MDPERWKQVNELLDAAFDLPPENRSTFLDQACVGNEDLRKQLEGLLASDERASNFIEIPVLQAIPELLPKPQAGLTEGQSIGPYKILSQVGKGGMGEVYAAQDTRLKRKVAIKVLPAHLSESAEMRIRFEREARSVSSLSHPNICSVYDVGHQDSIHYLVMEYIEGKNLAELIKKGQMPIKTILDLAF